MLAGCVRRITFRRRGAFSSRDRFLYGVTVTAIQAESGRIARVDTDRGPVTADAFVVALGSYAPQMLKPLGIQLPVYPVRATR